MVITAKEIGFCFGVKRAVSLCEKALKEYGQCVSFGPIIHNERVIKRLCRAGLTTITEFSGEDVKRPVIIRSHGIHPEMKKDLLRHQRKVVDATCPFVRKVQDLVMVLKREGYTVIIIGKPEHPEVKALAGFAGEGSLIYPVGERLVRFEDEEKKKLLSTRRLAIVSQTTNTREGYYQALRSLLEETAPPEARIFNTVCRVTERRRAEAAEIAKRVDILLVIGSRKSANTTNLYRMMRRIKPQTYLISGADQIKNEWYRPGQRVGLVSGTSTPQETIEEVKERLKGW